MSQTFKQMTNEQKKNYLDCEMISNLSDNSDIVNIFNARIRRFSFILDNWAQNKSFFTIYFADENFRSQFIYTVISAAASDANNVNLLESLYDSSFSDDYLDESASDDVFFLEFISNFYMEVLLNSNVPYQVMFRKDLSKIYDIVLVKLNTVFLKKVKELKKENIAEFSSEEKILDMVKVNSLVEQFCIPFVGAFKEGDLLPWKVTSEDYSLVGDEVSYVSGRNLAQRMIALTLFYGYTAKQLEDFIAIFPVESLNKRFYNTRHCEKVGLFNVLFYKLYEGYEEGFGEVLFNALPGLNVDEQAITSLLVESGWGVSRKVPKEFIIYCINHFDESLLKKIIKEQKSNLGTYVYSLFLNDSILGVVNNNSEIKETRQEDMQAYKL